MIETDRDPDELIDVDLSEDERYLLLRGVSEWQGSARCSQEMAVALGFRDVADLRIQGQRIAETLEREQPLSRWDWSRCLLSTELVFASSSMGSALDWSTVFGRTDQDTIGTLRSVQIKLLRIRVPIGRMVYSLDMEE